MILQVGGIIEFTAKRIAGKPVYATFGAVSNVEMLEGITHFTFPFPEPPAGSVKPTAIQVHIRKLNEDFPTLLELSRETDRYGRTAMSAPDPVTGFYPGSVVVSVDTQQQTANSPTDVDCKAIAIAFYPDQPAT